MDAEDRREEVKVLNLGCGDRKIHDEGEIGLDIKEPCDVLHDLNIHPLPFEDEEFDEIYAFHVLEHIGRQGDWKFFFEEFTEYHRILKPLGILRAIVPSIRSVWLWGDPGHTRAFPPQWLQYLRQDVYEDQIGKTGMADYRGVWKGHFNTLWVKDSDVDYVEFLIQKEGK